MNTSLYHSIDTVSSLADLHPSPQVDAAFTTLVRHIARDTRDAHSLGISQAALATTRQRAAQAEYYMEVEVARRITTNTHPARALTDFQYYDNYISLSTREVSLLNSHASTSTASILVVGSGPLPLSALCFEQLGVASVHSIDNDAVAVELGTSITRSVGSNCTYSHHDAEAYASDTSYDAVLIAALVGTDITEKLRYIRNLSRSLTVGGHILVRSAWGARTLLYPAFPVEQAHDTMEELGLALICEYHPHDDVINSTVLYKKVKEYPHA